MAIDDIERVNYYERQYLGVADFTSEETYHRDMRRRHNLGQHTWGIVVGLDLTQQPSLGSATSYDTFIQPGMATDGFGREIFVLAPQQLDPADFQRFTTSGYYDVWIEYRQQLSQPPAFGYAQCDVQNQFARVVESFHIVTGTQPNDHDQVTVNGKLVGPPGPPSPGDPPLPPDDSVPFQEFPDDSTLPRWLIHLGRVNWDATSQQFLQSDAANLALNRRYVSSVAAAVLAPAAALRLADRNSPSPLGAADNGVQAVVEGSLEVSRKLTADQDALVSGALEVQGAVTADADLYVAGSLGVGTKTPRNPLGVRGRGATEELVSFEDAGGATKWHLNGKVNPANPGLNFAETSVADGRLYLQAGGNVGIGTLSPSNRLHVNDATGIRQNRLYLSGGNGWSSFAYNAYHDAANANWVFPDTTRPAVTVEMDDNGGAPRFQVWSTTAAATGAWQLRFGVDGDTGNTALAPSGGRIGIGATAPQAALHIRSDEPHVRLETTGNRAVVQVDKGGLQWDFGVGTGPGNFDFWIGDFTEYRLVLQKATKNLGIGTQTPKNPLGIRARGASENLLSLESPDGTTRWEINQNGGTNRGLNLVDTQVGAGARLFVEEGSGNVGIGTSGPLARLHVIGEVRCVDLNVSGTKNFMTDHPLDPRRKYLVHSSLEGPEVGVFYRGEGRLDGGTATITLPPYFEALTKKEGRTVLLTPKYEEDSPASALAASAVENGAFAVRQIGDGNAGGAFYWEVKAERATPGNFYVELDKEATEARA